MFGYSAMCLGATNRLNVTHVSSLSSKTRHFVVFTTPPRGRGQLCSTRDSWKYARLHFRAHFHSRLFPRRCHPKNHRKNHTGHAHSFKLPAVSFFLGKFRAPGNCATSARWRENQTWRMERETFSFGWNMKISYLWQFIRYSGSENKVK